LIQPLLPLLKRILQRASWTLSSRKPQTSLFCLSNPHFRPGGVIFGSTAIELRWRTRRDVLEVHQFLHHDLREFSPAVRTDQRERIALSGCLGVVEKGALNEGIKFKKESG
jgi:hypothetical protein